MKPKIFAFISGTWGDHNISVTALAEDGTVLAGHICSNKGFAEHDIGITSDWKHENYNKHYPDGWEIIWLDEPKENPEFLAALKLNQEKGKS